VARRRHQARNQHNALRYIGYYAYAAGLTQQKNRPWMDPDRLKGTTPTAKRDSIQFLNFHHPIPLTENFPGEAAWMDNQYKLVTDGRKTELFDIVADPLEQKNLAKDKSRTAARMKVQLEAWQASVEKSLAGQDY